MIMLKKNVPVSLPGLKKGLAIDPGRLKGSVFSAPVIMAPGEKEIIRYKKDLTGVVYVIIYLPLPHKHAFLAVLGSTPRRLPISS